MIAEILSTGDEVCQGTVVDSNAAHIAAVLAGMGISISRHTCVEDDLDALTAVLLEIAGRADFAVVTGGLGPTGDDLTAASAASAAGVPLMPNTVALSSMAEFFKRFSRSMSESDRKQALLPEGASPLPNPCGTAPGFSLNIARCRFYFLPGVPVEMAHMLSASVIPEILARNSDAQPVLRTRSLSVFGIPEARVNDRLKGFEILYPGIRLGMMARFPVIYVKLSAIGERPEDIERDLASAHAWVMDRIGDHVFSPAGETMEETVGKLLVRNRATLSIAESCTGGLISDLITNVAGSSAYFLFSAVTYANEAKVNILGVSEDIIAAFGAVSEETARQMAECVKRMSCADYGLSVTGIAGPSGATTDKPVGTVCIGIAGPQRDIFRKFQSPFTDRLYNKQIFAMCALDLLRKELEADGNQIRKTDGLDG